RVPRSRSRYAATGSRSIIKPRHILRPVSGCPVRGSALRSPRRSGSLEPLEVEPIQRRSQLSFSLRSRLQEPRLGTGGAVGEPEPHGLSFAGAHRADGVGARTRDTRVKAHDRRIARSSDPPMNAAPGAAHARWYSILGHVSWPPSAPTCARAAH